MPPIHTSPSSPRAIHTRPSSAPPKAIPVAEPVADTPFGTDQVSLSHEARRGSTASINEERERALLELNKGRGFAVPIHQGRRDKPVTLTVHGINGSPDVVKGLSDAAARRGETVHAFVYNDQKGGLSESSADLAQAIKELRKNHPGQKLNIASHSMGGRLSADALRRLGDEKALGGAPIHQQMYGPMIGGNGMANTARFAPGFLNPAIKGLKPGREMGTNSDFQKTLEATALPRNVKTDIYVGDKDTLVSPTNPHFRWVADGLNARTHVLPGADHMNVLERGSK